jgi:hypothetical protein
MATFSRESFDYHKGYNNEDIKSINQKIREIQEKIKPLQNEINELLIAKQKIRNECEHEYMFVSMGAYDDSYKCRKCGKEVEI